MKKMLILMLVLGFASTASASLVLLSVDGATAAGDTVQILEGATITLSVISDGPDPWLMEVSTLVSGATLGLPTATAAAGGMADYADYSDATMWDYELATGGVISLPTAGVQWTMDLTAVAPRDSQFTVDLGEYGAAPADSILFEVIPEPVSILLLGLGGLFLRRRK